MVPLFDQLDRRLILASQSPRRKEILEKMHISFSTVIPSVSNEESFFSTGTIAEAIQRLAAAKAESVAKLHPEEYVLGSDTVVVCDERVMGKPADRDDARDMIQTLAGRSHMVYSGVALVCKESQLLKTAVAETAVYFRQLTDLEIDQYLEIADYQDKAGAYAIQQEALVFITRIDGCFYNVMGLPIAETLGLFA